MKLRGGTGIFFLEDCHWFFFTCQPTQVWFKEVMQLLLHIIPMVPKLANPALANLAGPMITDVNEMIRRLNLPNTILHEDGVLPRDINGVDPNFKMPQVWKSSLAVDYQVPVSFPLSVTVEGIYTKTMNGSCLKI
jgi:hypothetical protein